VFSERFSIPLTRLCGLRLRESRFRIMEMIPGKVCKVKPFFAYAIDGRTVMPANCILLLRLRSTLDRLICWPLGPVRSVDVFLVLRIGHLARIGVPLRRTLCLGWLNRDLIVKSVFHLIPNKLIQCRYRLKSLTSFAAIEKS
jgi:hypothetical protein